MITSQQFNPLYGINGGPGAFWPNAAGPTKGFVDVSKQYQKIGVRRIRFHDYFGAGDMMQFFPLNGSKNVPDLNNEDNYYWKETDRQFCKIRDGGFDCLIQVGQGWRNMASWAPFEGMELEGYQLNPQKPTKFWPNINQIARQVAPDLFIKYLDHIWSLDPDHNGDRYVEFWNEPNIQSINTVPPSQAPNPYNDKEFLNTKFRNYEWDGTPLQFYELFECCAKAIKRQYCARGIKIGGPALWNPGADSPVNLKWIELFFDHIRVHKVPMDFISWSLYSDEPDEFTKNYKFIQYHLDRIGYCDTQQVISEYAILFNNKTTLPDGREIPNSLLAKGAAIATSIWIRLQEFSNLAMAYYYRGNDGPFVPNGVGFPILLEQKCGQITNPNPNNFGPTGVGMFHGNGKKKPVARAFKLWSNMAHLKRLDPRDVITCKVPYSGRLYLLAGENNKNENEWIILGSYRNDLSTLNASIAISDTTVKCAVIETVLDDKVVTEEINDPQALQNIQIEPNRAFHIFLKHSASIKERGS